MDKILLSRIFWTFPFLLFDSPSLADIPPSCLDYSLYPASVEVHEPYAEPKVDASRETKRFRTVLRRGAQGEPDFGGRFRVIEIGCGSNCHGFSLVDKENGSVYMTEVDAQLEATYHINSNLFVADPPRID